MFTPTELFVAWRYTRARRRAHFISFISATAISGVALGLAALITILSIMNGFEAELRDRILGMAAHIVVEDATGMLSGSEALARELVEFHGVEAAAPYIAREAMLTHYDGVQGALIRGIEPAAESTVSVVAEKMVDGDISRLETGAFRVVLGAGLANSLAARVGSRVTLVVPQPLRTPAGLIPRLRRFEVVGIFEAGVHQYDTSMALIHIDDAARLFRYGNRVSGVRLKLDDAFAAPDLGAEISKQLGDVRDQPEIRVTDWTQTNVNLFRALKTEKIVMFIVLALTVGVAAFNLVSTLVMTVGEKNAEIAILRTHGMSQRQILLTFFLHGGLIGIAGVVAGGLLGVLLALNVDGLVRAIETVFNFKVLAPDVYYISEIPTLMQWSDVVVALTVAAILCVVAPLYPAYMASHTEPAAALRYD